MKRPAGRYHQNKRKIINDPVYGFLTLPDDLVFEIIEHPYFQRLRRIMQLGLSFYVYPGAVHNRFQHALGASHLMTTALDIIQKKGYQISRQERLGAILAILLHDVGHGPFSHATEHVFVKDVSHETLSLRFMKELNRQFSGQLDVAIEIFTAKHDKRFLRQLVSSQIDMDRLDYLRRDSYFTGVTEGIIGSERIIKMLRVVDDSLVVDKKGIYSIEKFLISRRLMYWQVYLHKTALAAEQLLIKTLLRARELADGGTSVYASPALALFLFSSENKSIVEAGEQAFLEAFAQLDDTDVFSALKSWIQHPDPILSQLAFGLLNRQLPAIRIQDTPFDVELVADCQAQVCRESNISKSDVHYIVFTDSISNSAYNEESDQVMLYENTGELIELSAESDIINPQLLSRAANKYFLCFPKSLSEYY